MINNVFSVHAKRYILRKYLLNIEKRIEYIGYRLEKDDGTHARTLYCELRNLLRVRNTLIAELEKLTLNTIDNIVYGIENKYIIRQTEKDIYL